MIVLAMICSLGLFMNTGLMITASHQTFSGQLWHLTDQTKFDQTNLLYRILQIVRGGKGSQFSRIN